MEAKKVVITGVTRGLGRAMAESFAALGHHVFGCGRSEANVAELAAILGNPHQISVVDVTSDGAVKEWSESIRSIDGAPNLLINNAGAINRNALLWELHAEEFDQVIDTNIRGTANIIRHFVPLMLDKGLGVIANFSSGWGRSTSAEVVPYCASKWAIEGLTKALAKELPRGFAAVAVNPGIIETEMLHSCFGAAASSYPLPKKWAEKAVPFLLKLGPKDNGKSVTIPS